MKTLVYFLSVLFFVSCGKKKEEKTSETNKKTENTEVNKSTENNNNDSARQDLDWDKIAVSDEEIGDFPYFEAPDGLYIRSGEKTGYTSFNKFDKQEFFLGNGFYEAQGKSVKIYFNAKETWSSLFFTKSIENQLNKFGAVKVFEGTINRDKFYKLQETVPDLYNYTFNIGEVVKVYAIKQENKKILIQIFSNTVWGEVNFVELGSLD